MKNKICEHCLQFAPCGCADPQYTDWVKDRDWRYLWIKPVFYIAAIPLWIFVNFGAWVKRRK